MLLQRNFCCPKIFSIEILNGEVVKEELLDRTSFWFTYKPRFKEDTVTIKELIPNKGDGTGKKAFLKRKNFESVSLPYVINFESICWEVTAIYNKVSVTAALFVCPYYCVYFFRELLN